MIKTEAIRRVEGVQSVESIMQILKVDRTKAMKFISSLRRKGYVKTKQTSSKKRIYYISLQNKLGGKSYYEIINENSPVKLSEPEIYKIYGRVPSFEETLIYAIKTRKLRVILASLSLFKNIKNWKLLNELARENRVERFVGALYDLSRLVMKVRRMNGLFRNGILPKNDVEFVYLIQDLKSKDFIGIEKTWKVYLPFNMADLSEYAK